MRFTIQYNTIQYNTIQYNTIQYNTIQYINTWMIQYNFVENFIQSGATCFSIKSEDDSYSFIHITFYQDKCYAKCNNGIWSVKYQNRKKLKKRSLKNPEKLCIHMHILNPYLDKVQTFFPNYFKRQQRCDYYHRWNNTASKHTEGEW